MNRLRGVAIVQAAETEAVLAEILRTLDPSAGRTLMAGPLLRAVRKQLDAQTLDRWSQALDVIKEAINRRNRLVHDTVQVWLLLARVRHRRRHACSCHLASG